MSETNQSSEVKTKNITLGSVFAWIFGVVFGLAGIFQIFEQPAAGVILLIIAAIVLPPAYNFLKEKFHLSLSRGLKIFIVLVLSVIGIALTPSNELPKNTADQGTVVQQPVAVEIIKVTAIKLSEDYKANEVSADIKYKGKNVEVSGLVDSIGKDILDTPYISLQTYQYAIVDLIQCMFSKNDESLLASVSKGQQITLSGKVSGKLGNILIKGCQIIK